MGRNKSRRDEFGFIVPKKFNFETLADVVKKEKVLQEIRKDHKEIESIIKYKPKNIAYIKFQGRLEQLINYGYIKNRGGWVRKLPKGEQFHAIIKKNIIYLHKDEIKKGKHVATINEVPSEIKRLLTYKKPINFKLPKDVEIVKIAKISSKELTKSYLKRLRDSFKELIHLT